MSDSPGESPSINRHMLRGSGWGLATAWGSRAAGLLSMIVLARLLTPMDFGILAMAMLTGALALIVFEIGVDTLLIRKPEVGRPELDTGWTLNLLRGILVATAIFLAAPLAAMYFAEPRAVEAVRWIALAPLIRGAANIGTVHFRRELDFAKEFRFQIYIRLSQVAVAVVLAIILRNYWALVAGQIAAAVAEALFSYAMHPYRPRLSLARAREFLVFSGRMMSVSIGWFCNEKADSIVVGGLGNTAMLGSYHAASELSATVTSQPLMTLGRGLFPTYAKIVGDSARLTPALVRSIGAVAPLVFALGAGLSSVAHDFVLVVLGEKWISAAPLLQWLAFYALFRGINQFMAGNFVLVPGGERAALRLGWCRLAVLVPTIVGAGLHWGVFAVPIAATLVVAMFMPVTAYVMTRILPISAGQLLAAVWRPALAAAAMAVAVNAFELPWAAPAIGLLADVACGAVTFGLTLLALWWLAGRPDGLERVCLQAMQAHR